VELDEDPRYPIGKDAFLMLRGFLLSFVYDAMFFSVAGDNGFLDLYKSLNVTGLHRFVEWVYEDFEYIRSLSLPFDTMMDAVIYSGRLTRLR
jgi:hypothetical protein